MRLARFLYFTIYFVIGAQLPYLPIFLDDIGFSHQEIGALIGIQSFSIFLTPLLFAHLADSSSRSLKLLFIVGTSLTALMGTVLCFQTEFLPALLVALSFGMFLYPLFSLLDGVALALVSGSNAEEGGAPRDKQESAGSFSKLRFWGTVGFIVPSLLLAPSQLLFFVPSTVPIFLGSAMAALISISLLFMGDSFPRSFAPPPGAKIPILEALVAAKASPTRWVILANFLMGIAMATYYGFFPLKLAEIGTPSYAIGLVYNIGVVVEAGLLWFGPRILAKFDVTRLFLLGASSCLLRFLMLGSSDSLIVICLSQVLHAPIIFSVAVMSGALLNRYGEERYRYSLLSLNQLASFGAARLLGTILLPQFSFGISGLFLWAALFSAGAVYCAARVGLRPT